MNLFGKNSVIERLRFKPQSIRKIFIQHGYNGAGIIRKKANQRKIPVYAVPKSKIQKLARNTNTQGILASVDDFEYIAFEDVLENACKKKRAIVFLDGLSDPQNLGAIIRNLGCLGKFSIVLPTHNSVSVTEAVLRIASGGDNHLEIAKVSNLANAIKKAKDRDFRIAGAVVKDGQDLSEIDLTHRIGLVIGSEQKGIRSIVLKQLDIHLTIPMSAETLSYNAAHATTIICYEITKQNKKK